MGAYLKLSLASILLIISVFIVSCSVKPIKSSEEDARIVAMCDGQDIPYEQIRYLAISHKSDMEEEYGEGIWENEETISVYKDELKRRIEDDVKTYCTIISVSNSYNIHIDDDDIQEYVQKEVEYIVKEYYGSVSKYKKALAEEANTDSFFRFICGVYYCQNELYLAMTNDLGIISAPDDESELCDLIKEEVYRTEWVYIPFTYGEKTKEENRRKAEDIHDRVESGEIDFSQAIYEGGTDSTLASDGNYYLKGYADVEFESNVLSLDVGGISEVFELGGAFYIVKRLEPDIGYVYTNIYSFKTQYLQVQFNKILSEYKKDLSVTYSEELDLTRIK